MPSTHISQKACIESRKYNADSLHNFCTLSDEARNTFLTVTSSDYTVSVIFLDSTKLLFKCSANYGRTTKPDLTKYFNESLFHHVYEETVWIGTFLILTADL